MSVGELLKFEGSHEVTMHDVLKKYGAADILIRRIYKLSNENGDKRLHWYKQAIEKCSKEINEYIENFEHIEFCEHPYYALVKSTSYYVTCSRCKKNLY